MVLATEHALGEVTEGERQEGERQISLGVTVGGVGKTSARGRDGARGVSDVVGERLVLIDATGSREFFDRTVDDALGLLNQERRSVEVSGRCRHG